MKTQARPTATDVFEHMAERMRIAVAAHFGQWRDRIEPRPMPRFHRMGAWEGGASRAAAWALQRADEGGVADFKQAATVSENG